MREKGNREALSPHTPPLLRLAAGAEGEVRQNQGEQRPGVGGGVWSEGEAG